MCFLNRVASKALPIFALTVANLSLFVYTVVASEEARTSPRPPKTQPKSAPETHGANEIGEVALSFSPRFKYPNDGKVAFLSVSLTGVATCSRHPNDGKADGGNFRAHFPKQQFTDLANYIAITPFFNLDASFEIVSDQDANLVIVSGRTFLKGYFRQLLPAPKDAVLAEIDRRVHAITENLKWTRVAN